MSADEADWDRMNPDPNRADARDAGDSPFEGPFPLSPPGDLDADSCDLDESSWDFAGEALEAVTAQAWDSLGEPRESPWLEGLNPRQREAVLHADGPLLVVAGAGAGKTRVLAHRIAHLLTYHEVPSWSVLAITFTNKAAAEMRSRVAAVVGPDLVRQMWLSTFHSACVRILRDHAALLGYTRSFTIYDQSDSQRLVALCARELDLDPKIFGASSVQSAISAAKNELFSPETLAAKAVTERDRKISQIYALYEKRMLAANAMDFDSLLCETVRLLRTYDEVRLSYASRFRHILVDEYQDTNFVQYTLCRLLASAHGNLCVVGDSDQSIFSFRGADIRNILEFERDYPDAKVVTLEQNYRSTQPVLDTANALIQVNPGRPPKRLFTEKSGGDSVKVFQADNEHDEAAFVAREVDRLMDEEAYRMGDVAVFYRTNAQSRVLEEVFLRAGIAYRVVGGTRFYDRKEVKDALAYLRVVVNPADVVSLRRIINEPRRGIGDTTLRRLEAAADAQQVSLGEMVFHADQVTTLAPRARAAVQKFAEILTDLRAELATGGLLALVEACWEKTGYATELRAENTIIAQGRLENLEELLAVVQEFDREGGSELAAQEALAVFLEEASLVSEADKTDLEESAVTLMTLHNAKGLEFPVVFVVGLEEGVFPHARTLSDPDQIEEERRLAYVGITRARERLYLTHAATRSQWRGSAPVGRNDVSRFLCELPDELIERIGGSKQGEAWRRVRGYRSAQDQESFPTRANGFDDSRELDQRTGNKDDGPVIGAGRSGTSEAVNASLSLATGDRVRHRKFGDGEVVGVTGEGEKQVAAVRFPEVGEKKLVVAWAPLALLPA